MGWSPVHDENSSMAVNIAKIGPVSAIIRNDIGLFLLFMVPYNEGVDSGRV